ncbi:MAG: hypothetical protein UV73_C0005G0039 [Candidatus Gottesmanbacteria bacterium GW2011_GWA2_43_14]|uniref:Uncharacterized protein n=1 Tax=Candidatus Gottesmanbacteria bacterium GW2011_GWA2_43_14 TaxID=1618443 RepID=A0A0G1DJL6_9BACT|nr:MAG: hypothetical protein UV73_C0005G0039 [Candidatus Gottesmanbacteria bacterium GW2011_GWA2_43_14]
MLYTLSSHLRDKIGHVIMGEFKKGPWRNGYRASMAWKRLGVQIPSGPPRSVSKTALNTLPDVSIFLPVSYNPQSKYKT